MINCTCRDQI